MKSTKTREGSKMYLKRIVVVFLVSFLLFDVISVVLADDFPEIEDLDITPKEIQTKGLIRIRADVSDDIGLAEVYLYVGPWIGNTHKAYNPNWNPPYGAKTHHVDIPYQVPSNYGSDEDIHHVKLCVKDTGGHVTQSKYYRIVITPDKPSDKKKPVLSSSSVTPSSGPPGTIFTLKVRAKDNVGVENVTGRIDLGHGDTEFIYLDLYKGTPQNGYWRGEYHSPTSIPEGKYTVDFYAVDNAANSVIDEETFLRIKEEDSAEENHSPELSNAYVEPDEISPGYKGSFEYYVTYEDRDGDRPEVIWVNIGQVSSASRSFEMYEVKVYSSSGKYKALYRAEVSASEFPDELTPGSKHYFYVYCSDGEGSDMTKVTEGPVVTQWAELSVSVSATPSVIDAGGSSTIKVIVKSNGELVSQAEVSLKAEGGWFEDNNHTTQVSGHTSQDGIFTAIWHTDDPSEYTNSRNHLFTAEARFGYKSGSGTTTVTVNPASGPGDTTPPSDEPSPTEYKPKIYIHKNEKWDLEGVYYYGPFYGYDNYAKKECYCIEYWFKYNGDGKEARDDWEPVYVFIDLNGDVLYSASTFHWKWDQKDTDPDDFDGHHMKVYFAGGWHTPIIDYEESWLRILFGYVDLSDPLNPLDPSKFFDEVGYGYPLEELSLQELTDKRYFHDIENPFSQERREWLREDWESEFSNVFESVSFAIDEIISTAEGKVASEILEAIGKDLASHPSKFSRVIGKSAEGIGKMYSKLGIPLWVIEHTETVGGGGCNEIATVVKVWDISSNNPAIGAEVKAYSTMGRPQWEEKIADSNGEVVFEKKGPLGYEVGYPIDKLVIEYRGFQEEVEIENPVCEVYIIIAVNPSHDSDDDGIPDDQDQCPHEPGSPENMGCPQAIVSFIRDWLICGQFTYAADSKEKAHNHDYIGEIEIQPDLGKKSNKKTWKSHHDSDDYIDLSSLFSPNEYVVAYAHTYVYSPKRQSVQLRIGSDDAVKIWVNGNLVHKNYVFRAAAEDQDIVTVTLTSGWNRLLIKVLNGFGPWGFYARFTDKNGNEVKGLQYQLNDPAPALEDSDDDGIPDDQDQCPNEPGSPENKGCPKSVSTGTIEMYVRDDSGNRLPGATVYLDGEYQGITDDEGYLRIEEVPEGSYTVSASKSGYEESSKKVSVHGGKTVKVYLYLEQEEKEFGTIKVYVKDDSGNKLPGASVYLDSIYKGKTDNNGYLRIYDVSEGSYTVKVSKSGYEDDSKKVRVDAGKTETVYLTRLFKNSFNIIV
jgi:hypothetical protein